MKSFKNRYFKIMHRDEKNNRKTVYLHLNELVGGEQNDFVDMLLDSGLHIGELTEEAYKREKENL